MTTRSMLTGGERAAFAKRMADKAFGCGSCGGNTLVALGPLSHVALSVLPPTGSAHDASVRTLPVIVAGCKACGHIMFFGAKTLGFVDDKGEPARPAWMPTAKDVP